ncbi:MAG TPA: DNA primase small subunit domain-containing protein [Candidatus Nanoarchaeia archaeon]|nr:DNA primase small subunit domain-containing protein [Candidatus Nanoarchaeia archaeon]
MAEEIKKEDEKEKRVRAITKLYYSNPKVLEAIAKFSQDREVVPRYFEGFGKRPDKIQYPSDIMGLVNRGATSFHASEELWNEPLSLSSEMTQEEMSNLRKSWDLLIDIDSPFLDCSKIAAKLIIAALEHYGIRHYGLKFSGSKGFHIMVSGKAFPKEYDGVETRIMFPEWARAISEFLMKEIRTEYNKQVSEILTDFEAIKRRTNLSKEDLMEVYCKISDKPAKKGTMVKFKCEICGMEIERKNIKLTNRKLRCLDQKCTGNLEVTGNSSFYYCDYCKDFDNANLPLSSDKYPEYFENKETISAKKIAALDMILVAPRHLFRMPYSLHEKTALASIVMTKNQIDSFSPGDANPLKARIVNYLPDNEEGEAKNLLAAALAWKKEDDKTEEKSYKKYENYEKIDIKGVTEEMFPEPIKKLLLGLKDGKKRGLFILITFLRSLNFPIDYINQKIREWNKLNEPPLKEGYVRSQIDWHLRQKKTILPPNYDNAGFYKDIGLLDGRPTAKNPISEVVKKIRWNKKE